MTTTDTKQANDLAAAVLGVASLPLSEEALGAIAYKAWPLPHDEEYRGDFGDRPAELRGKWATVGVAVARAVVAALFQMGPLTAATEAARLRGDMPWLDMARATIEAAVAATLPPAADTPSFCAERDEARAQRDELASIMLGRPVADAADIPRAIAHARKLVEPFNRTMAKLTAAECDRDIAIANLASAQRDANVFADVVADAIGRMHEADGHNPSRASDGEILGRLHELMRQERELGDMRCNFTDGLADAIGAPAEPFPMLLQRVRDLRSGLMSALEPNVYTERLGAIREAAGIAPGTDSERWPSVIASLRSDAVHAWAQQASEQLAKEMPQVGDTVVTKSMGDDSGEVVHVEGDDDERRITWLHNGREFSNRVRNVRVVAVAPTATREPRPGEVWRWLPDGEEATCSGEQTSSGPILYSNADRSRVGWCAINACNWEFVSEPSAPSKPTPALPPATLVIPPRTLEWAGNVNESYTNSECAMAAFVMANVARRAGT